MTAAVVTVVKVQYNCGAPLGLCERFWEDYHDQRDIDLTWNMRVYRFCTSA